MGCFCSPSSGPFLFFLFERTTLTRRKHLLPLSVCPLHCTVAIVLSLFVQLTRSWWRSHHAGDVRENGQFFFFPLPLLPYRFASASFACFWVAVVHDEQSCSGRDERPQQNCMA